MFNLGIGCKGNRKSIIYNRNIVSENNKTGGNYLHNLYKYFVIKLLSVVLICFCVICIGNLNYNHYELKKILNGFH